MKQMRICMLVKIFLKIQFNILVQEFQAQM